MIITLPHLSVFLCFGYLWILQNIAKNENLKYKLKVLSLVAIKIKDATDFE